MEFPFRRWIKHQKSGRRWAGEQEEDEHEFFDFFPEMLWMKVRIMMLMILHIFSIIPDDEMMHIHREACALIKISFHLMLRRFLEGRWERFPVTREKEEKKLLASHHQDVVRGLKRKEGELLFFPFVFSFHLFAIRSFHDEEDHVDDEYYRRENKGSSRRSWQSLCIFLIRLHNSLTIPHDEHRPLIHYLSDYKKRHPEADGVILVRGEDSFTRRLCNVLVDNFCDSKLNEI